MKTLIVIDMQNDFINGSLGTEEACAIVDNVKKKIKEYEKNGDEIIFTRDTHYDNYLETFEGKKLPVMHCIKNTDGWQIFDGLITENAKIIDKETFGYTGWNNVKNKLCISPFFVTRSIHIRRRHSKRQSACFFYTLGFVPPHWRRNGKKKKKIQ